MSALDSTEAFWQKIRHRWTGAPDHDAFYDVLRRMGADAFPHARGRTLLEHLMGTHRILAAWNQPAIVQTAGLFHSIYSTVAYRNQLLSYADRKLLRSVIGEDEERLVYLFSQLSRQEVLASLSKGSYFPTLQNEPPTVPELEKLAIIHAANLADQGYSTPGSSGILTELARVANHLSSSLCSLPQPLLTLNAFLNSTLETHLNAVYCEACNLLDSSPARSCALFVECSDLCPSLAEPMLWRAHFASMTGDHVLHNLLAAEARRLLEAWGTQWDKSRSYEDWLYRANKAVGWTNPFGTEVRLDQKPHTSIPPTVATSEVGDRVSGELARFHAYLSSFTSETVKSQMGTYPGLAKNRWYESGQFPLALALEENFPVIQAEILAISPDLFSPERERIQRQGDWDVLMLYERGRRVEGTCSLCPTLSNLLAQHESVKTMAGLTYVSRLRKNTTIASHVGPTNLRIRCHLGVAIPSSNCALSVGGEERTWQVGKCLIFDDSFEHRVWNNSDGDRIVVITDLWHPDLSDIEIQMLKGLHSFTARNAASLTRYWQVNSTSNEKKRVGYD